MISDALAAYIRSNISLNVYFNQAPLDSQPCVVIDDNGDFRNKHWEGGGVATGLIDQEYEITIYTDLENGGAKYAAQQAESLIALLDNFAGPLVDTAASPNTSHRIAHIEANSAGGSFAAGAEIYGYSLSITITYAG